MNKLKDEFVSKAYIEWDNNIEVIEKNKKIDEDELD